MRLSNLLPKYADEGNEEELMIVIQKLQSQKDVHDVKNQATVALHLACQSTNLNVVDLILDNLKVFINQKDEYGKTALHYGIHCSEIFKKLLLHPEIDLYVTNNESEMCFDISDVPESCTEIVKEKITVDMEDCINQGDTNRIIDSILPIVKKFKLFNEYKYGSNPQNKNTFLHLATEKINIPLVKKLLSESSVNVNGYNANGHVCILLVFYFSFTQITLQTPFHIAIKKSITNLVVPFLNHSRVNFHLQPKNELLLELTTNTAIITLIQSKLQTISNLHRTEEPMIIKPTKQTRLLNMSQLITLAKNFVQKSIEVSIVMGTNHFHITENTSLTYNCPALQRFEAALKLDLNCSKLFAWHGTDESLISSICHAGFDPKQRQGQAHGQGEYFGTTATAAIGYAKGKMKRLLLVYILQTNQVKNANNSVIVVNNPLNWSVSYVLPLLVISASSFNPLQFTQSKEEELFFLSKNYNILQQTELQLHKETRMDYILELCHILIWKLDCSIYGGVVRDCFINEEEPKDIDAALPSWLDKQIAVDRVVKCIEQYCERNQLKVIKQQKSKIAFTLQLHGPWNEYIDIDLVSLKETRISPPFVDSDVGNLLIDKYGLKKKVENVGVDLLTAIEHCKARKFVFYYCTTESEKSHRTMCLQRLEKYFSRKWTCLNSLHDLAVDLVKYSAFMKPDAQFEKDWTIL